MKPYQEIDVASKEAEGEVLGSIGGLQEIASPARLKGTQERIKGQLRCRNHRIAHFLCPKQKSK